MQQEMSWQQLDVFFELLRTKNLTFSLTSELIDELSNESMSFFF